MALYTYDEEADALYILVAPEAEASIARTIEINESLHVDVDDTESVVGIEILYPTRGRIDLSEVRERFGLELRLPFDFAA